MIQLDTNFLIGAMVKGSAEDTLLRTWLEGGESIGISSLAWTEFICGPLNHAQQQLARAIVGEPIPFHGEHARQAALLFNATGRRRGSLIDCMIAAVAMTDRHRLATNNPTLGLVIDL